MSNPQKGRKNENLNYQGRGNTTHNNYNNKRYQQQQPQQQQQQSTIKKDQRQPESIKQTQPTTIVQQAAGFTVASNQNVSTASNTISGTASTTHQPIQQQQQQQMAPGQAKPVFQDGLQTIANTASTNGTPNINFSNPSTISKQQQTEQQNSNLTNGSVVPQFGATVQPGGNIQPGGQGFSMPPRVQSAPLEKNFQEAPKFFPDKGSNQFTTGPKQTYQPTYTPQVQPVRAQPPIPYYPPIANTPAYYAPIQPQAIQYLSNPPPTTPKKVSKAIPIIDPHTQKPIDVKQSPEQKTKESPAKTIEDIQATKKTRKRGR